MKNIAALILSIALLVAAGFGLSSCKDDDPPVRPKLSFAETSITVNEDDGNLEVELVLDKPHSKDLRIEFSLGGTASDQDKVGTAGADYEVVGDHDVVEIPAGETSGIIELEIYPDAEFEGDETIEISILDTNTDEIEVTADDEVEITITNDDAQLTVSFQHSTMTFNERDGVEVSGEDLVLTPVNVPVLLDKAAPVDVVVNYTIKIDLEDEARNDAIDSTWGYQNQIPRRYYDYYIPGTAGQLSIPKGATTANIELMLITDFMFEDDETIEITLQPSSATQVGTNSTTVIDVEEQDGKVVALVWDNAHTDVDLDMFLWAGADTTDLDLGPAAITPSFTIKNEIIFIPALFSGGGYGLSYVYYQGTADPMNFEVRFVDFADGVVEAEADWDIFSASYGLANINPWDTETGVYPPAIAHRFVITDGVYTYGKIQVPASGSRINPNKSDPPKPVRTNKIKPGRMIGR